VRGDIHPEAIALVVYNERTYNPNGFRSDYVQLLGYYLENESNSLFGAPATVTLPGKGLGFGSMHTGAVNELYPDWTLRQTIIARMNFDYAAPLIAADMDQKATIYEQITGGRISIRNDPVMLTWAFNTSIDNVVSSAEAVRSSLDAGAQSVAFDVYQNSQMQGGGMAVHSIQNLPLFPTIQPLVPLAPSAVPYTFGSKPPAVTPTPSPPGH